MNPEAIAKLITEDPDVINENWYKDWYEGEAEVLEALRQYLEQEGISMETSGTLAHGVPPDIQRHPEIGPPLFKRSPRGRIGVWRAMRRGGGNMYTVVQSTGPGSEKYLRFNIHDPESFPKVKEFILKHTT